MTLLLLLACGSEPPPPEPEPVVETPAAVTWTVHRDAVSRWTADLPAEPKPLEEKSRALRPAAEGEDAPPELVWFETTGRSYGAMRAEYTVGWTPRPADREVTLSDLGAMAHAPAEVAPTTISGFEALKWEHKDVMAHHTRAVAITPERLYFVRFLDNEKERQTDAHARFFDSFAILAGDALTEAERGAADTFFEDRAKVARAVADAEAESAQKQADIAAGIRRPDAELVKQRVLEQSRFMTCMVPNHESGAIIAKVNVRDGKVSRIRIYDQPSGWSNRMPKPQERSDQLSLCIAAAAAEWTFDPDLAASGVEVPMTFW